MNATQYREHLAAQAQDLGALEALLDAAGIPEESREYDLDYLQEVEVYFPLSDGQVCVSVVENKPTEPVFAVECFSDDSGGEMNLSEAVAFIRSLS